MTVVVVDDPTPEPEPEPTPEPDAIVDVVLAEQVGALSARVQYLEDLVSLHSHEDLIGRSDLQECEERLCSRMDSIAPVVPEPDPEPIPEPPPEPPPANDPPPDDSPPRSRKRSRKSIADWYYGR